MSDQESAGLVGLPDKPRDWDKAVAAAYLRLIGGTQVEAAEGAGLGLRTLQGYEKCEWWAEAQEEASNRWLKHIVGAARHSLAKGIKDDPNLAFKVLERMDPRLLPPKQRMELGGHEGGPIEFTLVLGDNAVDDDNTD